MMQRLKQSWLAQLAALERDRGEARRTHYTHLDEGETWEAWRNDLVARGEARATDRFVGFRWKSPDEPPTAPGGDGPAP
jgi:hypothetical protein